MNSQAEQPLMPTADDTRTARVTASLAEPPAASPRQSAGVDMDAWRVRREEEAQELRAFAACLAEHFSCPALATHDHAMVRLGPMRAEIEQLVRQLPAGAI